MLILCLTSAIEFPTKSDAAMLDDYIAQIAQGNTAALAQLYHKTSASVYGFALSILKSTHDAQDVLQDLYISVHTSAASYRSSGKPMAWILTITRNLCLIKIRERKKTADAPPQDWERYFDERETITPEDKQVLTQCMTRLTDEERQIVVLHAVAGFKHREIAQIMDLLLPTVLSKYNRALKKLKEELMKGEWLS